MRTSSTSKYQPNLSQVCLVSEYPFVEDPDLQWKIIPTERQERLQ